MRCSIYADLWQYTTNASYTQDFAAWLKGLADTSELSNLAQWADRLAQQTSMFEMQSMADTLMSYSVLLDDIRSLL